MVQPNPRFRTVVRTGATVREGIDEGLRAFMLGIYNNMALGLAITAIASLATNYLATTNPAVAQALYGSPLKWVVMLAPLAFVFFLSARINKMQPATARLVFFAFAAVMGVSISWIFLVYTSASITQTFFVTSAAFAGLSLWGYTTKKDISAWGSFLIMGVIGLIIVMVVNIFLQSPALQFAVSAIGLLIFAGLTAFHTQKLKNTYDLVAGDATAAGRVSVIGALQLYLDFLNMFMFLLHFMGNRN
ncbi:MAG: Bax inhibitor-1/YccA family protein [Alphaproteobacteria bacterium]|nr:MAG: Bax inhibitor-1/YccA family protein [Alphaproteobacteria bacterium]